MWSFIISHQKHIGQPYHTVCKFSEKTVLPFEACMSSVLQVWIRRTSSCRRALLCPAGGALATDRPVRSRSSVAPAASNDPASRRSSDGPGYVRPSSTSSSSSYTLPSPQPARPHAALNFILFLFPTPSSWPSPWQEWFCVLHWGGVFRNFSSCSGLFFRAFIEKEPVGGGGEASCVLGARESLATAALTRQTASRGQRRKIVDMMQLQFELLSDRKELWSKILQFGP